MAADKRIENLKVIALYSAITLGVLGGAAFGTVQIVKNFKRKNAESNSLDEGSPENIANQLYFAFENSEKWYVSMGMGWGTDTESVRRIFKNDIKSKDHYDKVIKAYAALYKGKSLNRDLRSELENEPSVYRELTAILASKPQHTPKAKKR